MPVSNPLAFAARNPSFDLAQITGGMAPGEVLFEVQRGGRFVVYQYVVSALIVTFRRNSKVVFVKAGESAAAKSLPYTLASLAVAWWGFPWGLIYTPTAIYKNLNGGTDVTQAVCSRLGVDPQAFTTDTLSSPARS